jgi:hypothetical protein
MLPLACLLLLAASRVEVTDEVYQIPANDWRYVEISLNQRTAFVSAQYTVLAGAPQVRAALLPKDELKDLRATDGLSDYEPTPAGGAGQLKRSSRLPGDYAVVVENRSPSPASVRIRIWLDFPVATQISPRRQFTVVAISFAVFFAIAGFSAKRLLKAIRR